MHACTGYKTVLFFCCLLFWAPIMGQKKLADAPKIAPALLIKDLQTLHKILKQNHPSIYWYTPKDSMDFYFSSALASVKDSMSVWAFKNVVASYLAKIKCGHTSVHFSPKLTKQYAKYRFPQFPLQLKVWKDSAVVIGNLHSKDSSGILMQGLGDWFDIGPARPGYSQHTPQGLTATATYYMMVTKMESIASIIGNKNDALFFSNLALTIKKSFNQKFYNSVANIYGTGSQTANAIAQSARNLVGERVTTSGTIVQNPENKLRSPYFLSPSSLTAA